MSGRTERTGRAERGIALPADLVWRRMHPVSPLLEGWKIVSAIIAVVTIRNADNLIEVYRYVAARGFDLGDDLLVWALLGLLALIAVIVLVLLLGWWAKTYAVDRDGVYLRSGILNKQLRIARLPRIQSVDVVHPLLGRVLGLGRLTVEVAGGRDSRVVIGYLPTARLEELRERIEAMLPRPDIAVDVVVPYSRGDLVARVHADGEIESIDYVPEGTRVRARVDAPLAAELWACAVE